MATDGTATIALKGLDYAARMKGVMLAVQHDAAAWLVDRIHANGTRRVLVPKDTILVCGVVDALHKRVYALFLCKLHRQTETLLAVFLVHGRGGNSDGDMLVAAFGHREKFIYSKVPLFAESDSDDGIDSDDEEDEYEHYEKLVTTRILVSLDLETLNHCLVCYGCEPERRRRVAAKELARQLLQETDSEDSE